MGNPVDGYIGKQKSPQKEICQRLREIIFSTFPDAKEEMKWGVPAFDGGKFYVVALKNHVNLGFSSNGLTKEDLSLFSGRGKKTAHIEIDNLNRIDEKRIIGLLQLVNKKAKT